MSKLATLTIIALTSLFSYDIYKQFSLNKRLVNRYETRDVVSITIPFYWLVLDTNTMPIGQCSFGYTYRPKTIDKVFVINGLWRLDNEQIVYDFDKYYYHEC